MSDPTQRIGLDPEPPVQGKDVEISYDFDGLDIRETRLRVRFTPGGGFTDYTVKKSDGKIDVPVPANATSILVEDLDGPSPDKGSVIVPESAPQPI